MNEEIKKVIVLSVPYAFMMAAWKRFLDKHRDKKPLERVIELMLNGIGDEKFKEDVSDWKALRRIEQ